MRAHRLDRREWLLGTAALVSGPAWTQSGRPLILVVPQPAGNPSDVFIRKLQPVMQRELGQTIVVENVPGAGGALGVQRMLNAPPDGQMAVVVSQTEPILTPLSLAAARYQPEALRMVGLMGRTSYALVGRPDLPATSHAELVAVARKSGTQLVYGHIGHGSMIHLLGAQWSRQLGLQLNLVPYKGVPPLVQDLMGGQIDLAFIPLGGSALPLLETGKLRVFGLTAAQPSPLLPKAPLLMQQDAALRDFMHGAWGAVMLPRSAPASAVQRLHQAFAAAMRDTDVLAFLRANGTEPQAPLALDALDGFYRQEVQTYSQLARSVGVTPE